MDSLYANMVKNALTIFLTWSEYDKFSFHKVQTGGIYFYLSIFKHFQ